MYTRKRDLDCAGVSEQGRDAREYLYAIIESAPCNFVNCLPLKGPASWKTTVCTYKRMLARCCKFRMERKHVKVPGQFL